MSENFKLYNGFGITPTKSYAAAGWDFYVPNIINCEENADIVDRAIEAFKKSYNKSEKDIETAVTKICGALACNTNIDDEHVMKNIVNLLHLFFAIDGSVMRTSQNKVETFINYYLVWSDNGVPGIKLHCNDHTLFNSGIKVALGQDVAGVFLNKSGKGNKGFDTRAQVVDEDYSGYVHLSNAYTKDNIRDGIIYCGDKLTQMLLLPIVRREEAEELSAADYEELMKGSARGADAFGSTDVKQ